MLLLLLLLQRLQFANAWAVLPELLFLGGGWHVLLLAVLLLLLLLLYMRLAKRKYEA